MQYKMSVIVEDPNKQEGMTAEMVFNFKAVFTHDEEQYGNGHWLHIGGNGFDNYYDLRYNKDFHKDEKEKFLEEWAHSYWSGENGAWKVKELNIVKA